MGRPTKDIQSMLGLFIIQALFDLTDAEAIENYSFSDAYRYALDLPRDEYLAERTYYLYRSKLLGEGHEVLGPSLSASLNGSSSSGVSSAKIPLSFGLG